MTILAKYSPSTGGVYPLNVYKEFPQDAIDVPEELYVKFQNGEISGLTVLNGELVATSPEILDPRQFMEVTAFQAHAAIARAGLYEQVETLMSDPQTPLEVKLAWNKAQTFKRLSPTVITLGAALGLDDEALDNLFTLAATIDA